MSTPPSPRPITFVPSHFWLGSKPKQVKKLDFLDQGDDWVLSMYFDFHLEHMDTQPHFIWRIPLHFPSYEPRLSPIKPPLAWKIYHYKKCKVFALRIAEVTPIPYKDLSLSNNHFNPKSPNQEMQYIRFIIKLDPSNANKLYTSPLLYHELSDAEYEEIHKSVVHHAVQESRSPRHLRSKHAFSSSDAFKTTKAMSPPFFKLSTTTTTTTTTSGDDRHSGSRTRRRRSESSSSNSSSSHSPDPTSLSSSSTSNGTAFSPLKRRSMSAKDFYQPQNWSLSFFKKTTSMTPSSSSSLSPKPHPPTSVPLPSSLDATSSGRTTPRPRPRSPRSGRDEAKWLLDRYLAQSDRKLDRQDVFSPLLVYPMTPVFPMYYTPVTLRVTDLQGLYEGRCLNDVVIEFYLKHLLMEHVSMSVRSKVHLFSSFFFSTLSSSASGYSLVRAWNKRCQVFQKELWIIPMYEHHHWYLCLVIRPDIIYQQGRPMGVGNASLHDHGKDPDNPSNEEDMDEEEVEVEKNLVGTNMDYQVERDVNVASQVDPDPDPGSETHTETASTSASASESETETETEMETRMKVDNKEEEEEDEEGVETDEILKSDLS
ncbi:hypothetical protein HMI56_003657, partial [Coelomomyces lativittatus]